MSVVMRLDRFVPRWLDLTMCSQSLKNFRFTVVAPAKSRRLGHQLPFITFLIFCLGTSSRLDAQTHAYSLLHAFPAMSSGINADGANPKGKLLVYNDALYGTTYYGGNSGHGAVFRMKLDGSGFTNLYSFTGGSDGSDPEGDLAVSNDTLYGAATFGGASHVGTIFKINTDGTTFTTLYTCSGSTGSNPAAGLILADGLLYGTTYSNGGTSKQGTVFRLSIDGSGYTNLYVFPGTPDGGHPQSGLLLVNNTLYGATFYGGSSNSGTIFRINTDGSGYTNLYSFTGGSDGAYPRCDMTLYSNTLFGTMYNGSGSNIGTVFKINPDGSGFTNLHVFTGNDGAIAGAGLLFISNTLYGVTARGGAFTNGTVFKINPDGFGFANLYNFTSSTNGANPTVMLSLSGNTMYGASYSTGVSNGVVFGLTFPVPLGISRSDATFTTSWPSPSPGFSLQTNGTLATTNWANLDLTPNDDGTNRSIALIPAPPNLWFRLVHP